MATVEINTTEIGKSNLIKKITEVLSIITACPDNMVFKIKLELDGVDMRLTKAAMDFVEQQQKNQEEPEDEEEKLEEAAPTPTQLTDFLQRMQFGDLDKVSDFLKEKFGVEENLKLGPEMTQKETLSHLKDQMIGKKDDHDQVIDDILKPRKLKEEEGNEKD